MTVFRRAALAAISVLVAAASLTSFAESYRGLWLWATHHGLHGVWAVAWPLQIDTFIGVGELALFVALADGWTVRSRAGAWGVTVLGLAVSVAGNVGHIAGHDLASRATAAVPPLAAAAALAVGLGVLKRVVGRHEFRLPLTEFGLDPGAEIRNGITDLAAPAQSAPVDSEHAARLALAASVTAGNPLSQRQVMTRFGLTRTAERKVRQAVLAEANGHMEVEEPD
jgi:hypothetical protein